MADRGKRLSPKEAKAIMAGGLGDYELRLVNSFCTPLYWAVRNPDRSISTRNGTAFFLNTGTAIIGVTACHVIDGWRESRGKEDAGPLRLGGDGQSVTIDLNTCLVDADPDIDIATFTVTEEEVRSLGKMILTGAQKKWPPLQPPVQCGLYYSGYPGVGTRQMSPAEVCFGAAPGSGVATSVNEKYIAIQFEREYWQAAFGGELPPENYDFGGVSGGPVLTVVETPVRCWALAGVIYQGPNTSETEGEAILGFEVIWIRPAHFILPDGRLDRERWDSI